MNGKMIQHIIGQPKKTYLKPIVNIDINIYQYTMYIKSYYKHLILISLVIMKRFHVPLLFHYKWTRLYNTYTSVKRHGI